MPVESKRARFVNLAEGRMTKALNDIRLIGNLAAYEYNAADVEAMRTRLTEATTTAFAKFKGARKATKTAFTLPVAKPETATPEQALALMDGAGHASREHMDGTRPLNF